MVNEQQIYLFNKGRNYESFRFLGCLPLASGDDEQGYHFAVWAPGAHEVSLVGDMNDWQVGLNPMTRSRHGGIWTLALPEARQWQRYKYAVTGRDDQTVLKADPFARHHETRPGTASIVYDPDDYEWQDEAWLSARALPAEPAPLHIYELHLGSWRRYPDGNVYNYREIARQLGDYCLDMGFNCVELMPITEYPLDASWGYQVTGYFAPTSRYGTPDDFKFFVDYLHRLGIRVILDWVPAHFPRDAFGLARFDGGPLYEYTDPRIGEHREWGTLVFNYSRMEVVSFLISSAMFWISEFHLDGLRVDAVSSMLYTDFARTEFILNRYGGTENLEAIEFIKHLNSVLIGRFPGIYMIAEESTSYPYVTTATEEGGLGFTHKWNMGWMNDTLDYMDYDYYLRGHHHNNLTFSMTYAFSERYILPFSHDEVVHGKRSLIDRMPGDLWRKFACLRATLMYQMAHPGAKLNFMGYEFAQFIEWRFYEELEWFMLDYPRHRQTRDFVRTLNHFYLNEPCLWARERDWSGFSWLQVDDSQHSVYAFARHDGEGNSLVALFNLTPAPQVGYRLPMPHAGRYRVVLSSDDHAFDGSGYWRPDSRGLRFETEPTADAEGVEAAQPPSLVLDLPPLCAVYLIYEPEEGPVEA